MLGSAVQAPGRARSGVLTTSWWAHCGAAPGAHGARPGAGGGGGSRALGAAATSLQERAPGVTSRAGQSAPAGAPGPAARARLPPPPPRPLGAVLAAAPPCPRAPDRTGPKLGRYRGGAGPARRLPGESAWGARAFGLPLVTLVSTSLARGEPGGSLGHGGGGVFPMCASPRVWVLAVYPSHEWWKGAPLPPFGTAKFECAPPPGCGVQ